MSTMHTLYLPEQLQDQADVTRDKAGHHVRKVIDRWSLAACWQVSYGIG